MTRQSGLQKNEPEDVFLRPTFQVTSNKSTIRRAVAAGVTGQVAADKDVVCDPEAALRLFYDAEERRVIRPLSDYAH